MPFSFGPTYDKITGTIQRADPAGIHQMVLFDQAGILVLIRDWRDALVAVSDLDTLAPLSFEDYLYPIAEVYDLTRVDLPLLQTVQLITPPSDWQKWQLYYQPNAGVRGLLQAKGADDAKNPWFAVHWRVYHNTASSGGDPSGVHVYSRIVTVNFKSGIKKPPEVATVDTLDPQATQLAKNELSGGSDPIPDTSPPQSQPFDPDDFGSLAIDSDKMIWATGDNLLAQDPKK